MQCIALSHLGCRRLKALAGDPFSLSLFPLSCPPLVELRLPLFPFCISCEEEGRTGAMALWCLREVSFSMLPSFVWYVYGLWATPGWSIPWVCLSAGVATEDRCRDGCSYRDKVFCRDALPHRDKVAVAVPFLIAMVSRWPRRSRQYLCCLGCFHGSSWVVGMFPRAGLPLGPSGGERGRLPSCIQ
ncbi:hypothetical protein Taro_035648 [Colocasia esculenta]|uniref:Uncharacterized protein n=1 Tax=Colocasia esculenta TaxID=4460 RepID=A0A843W6A9_COLES|nr:hypothetical protein [Colocasia esculenta]